MDWLDLLAVQGTLKSLVQHHSSKASILPHSAFLTTVLTRQTFVDKVMSLLFSMLSRWIIAFLPRSKHLLLSWLQSPSVVILEPKKIKFLTVSIVSPSVCYEVMGPDAMILVFWMLSFKQAFSLSSFTFIKRLFSSSLLSAIGWCHLHIWGYWYFSAQSWFQLVLHPAQRFIWCTKLNNKGDNIQPWRTPFPIWNQSVVPRLVLTVASWPAYISQEAGQVVWYSHVFQNFPPFVVIHPVKGFGVVNKAEIVFLELSCFFNDPTDVGNWISGSFSFYKSSLNIWKFTVHILLKPGLENFEH